MLSFDEFKAVNNREKSATKKSSVKKESKSARAKEPVKTSPQTKSTLKSMFDSAGEFLEMHQMQILYIILVLADSFASLGELKIACDGNFNPFYKTTRSFTTFTLLFYVFELILALIVFGFGIFGHWGYLLDIAITGVQVYGEYHGMGKETRILNFFRFWRLIRLFNSMVSIEKGLHEQTLAKLEKSDEEVRRLQVDNTNLKTDIIKEKEARKSIEEMLQSYKDEVDTLNEALKIAAMDIAEVAQADEDMFQSEEEEGLGDDLGGYKDDGDDADDSASGSQNKKGKHKADVMRAVMEDKKNDKTKTATHSSTFLVHEDGTFEQK